MRTYMDCVGINWVWIQCLGIPPTTGKVQTNNQKRVEEGTHTIVRGLLDYVFRRRWLS